MPRPQSPRKVTAAPAVTWFKPAGVRLAELAEVVLTLDELEAMRLTDYEGLYQEQAAQAMQVSRPTLGRILVTARKKVSEALITGKAIRIEGGAVEVLPSIGMCCQACGQQWTVPGGQPPGWQCPGCGGGDVIRAEACQHGCGRNSRRF
ncbi:MAG: DUF134 domain-containing protein [Planctomycetota bacterium]